MTWKEFFWLGVLLFLVGVIFGLGLGWNAGINAEKQMTYIEILPSPVYYGEGKRGPLGALSPETIRLMTPQGASRDPEHWRMIWAVLNGLTTQAILDGPILPDGDSAPFRRAK